MVAVVGVVVGEIIFGLVESHSLWFVEELFGQFLYLAKIHLQQIQAGLFETRFLFEVIAVEHGSLQDTFEGEHVFTLVGSGAAFEGFARLVEILKRRRFEKRIFLVAFLGIRVGIEVDSAGECEVEGTGEFTGLGLGSLENIFHFDLLAIVLRVLIGRIVEADVDFRKPNFLLPGTLQRLLLLSQPGSAIFAVIVDGLVLVHFAD